VGKSKQELKRDRKKKKKGKPKREHRRRIKQEVDCLAVSSDGGSVDEPIESESPPLNVPCYSVTPTNDDADGSKPLQEQLHCTSSPRLALTSDGDTPGKPVVQTNYNGGWCSELWRARDSDEFMDATRSECLGMSDKIRIMLVAHVGWRYTDGITSSGDEALSTELSPLVNRLATNI
ncbi:hypothetical protein CRM22_001486, partial [Opisthorchis felineus]